MRGSSNIVFVLTLLALLNSCTSDEDTTGELKGCSECWPAPPYLTVGYFRLGEFKVDHSRHNRQSFWFDIDVPKVVGTSKVAHEFVLSYPLDFTAYTVDESSHANSYYYPDRFNPENVTTVNSMYGEFSDAFGVGVCDYPQHLRIIHKQTEYETSDGSIVRGNINVNQNGTSLSVTVNCCVNAPLFSKDIGRGKCEEKLLKPKEIMGKFVHNIASKTGTIFINLVLDNGVVVEVNAEWAIGYLPAEGYPSNSSGQ